MTTLNDSSPSLDYQGIDDIQAVLDGVGNRRWLVGVSCALLLFLAVSSGGLLLASLCGYWPDQPPATLRWMFLIVVLLAGAAGLWTLVRSLLQRSNSAQTARFIETHTPGLRNDLINAVLLSRDSGQTSPALVQCAIRETMQRTGRADFRQCVSLKPLRNAALLAALGVVALAGFIASQPGVFRRGVSAVLRPTSYVPANNTLQMLSLTPGDAEVLVSSPATIRLKLQAGTNKNVEAQVVIDGEDTPKIMHAVPSRPGEAAFEYRIAAVHEPLRYFVRASSGEKTGRWPADRAWFRIRVSPLHVESMNVHYEYPEYTHLPPRDVTLSPAEGNLTATAGSWATLSVKLNQSLQRGVVELASNRRMEMLRRDGGPLHQARLAVREDDAYRILLYDETGRELLRLPDGRAEQWYAIRATPDVPPKIAIIKPAPNSTAPAGGVVPVRIEAADDFGLTKVELLAGKENQPLQPVPGFEAKPEGNKKFSTAFRWPMTEYVEGDVVVYYAIATDTRNLPPTAGPQTSKTPTYKIRIQNPARAQAENAKNVSELQRRLLVLLERQIKLRSTTAIMQSPRRTLAQAQQAGLEVYAGQKRIHTDIKKLAQKFPFAPTMDDMRLAVTSLAANEAKLAVAQAESLTTITKRQSLPGLTGPLLQTQDAIITTLQEMLSILPAQARQLQNAKQQLGNDLTADQRREKREELTKAMKQFIDHQKKVIEGSQRLTKMALDDFTDKDQKILDGIIALQDQWEKFLNESFADFSKLAEQDFANPSLLKELLSVKADVTMATDALKAKAVEIATACENNGIENAESLTANIEKWLPDTPDRKKWVMESPQEQDNIEQAELFTELEDLMGELLEEEEDLFEEMDDVSSKATMSGDKAIGWDAMDGPISNMNAQGVTGNRLPNTSEIQGRSGEGRTGKSSGEFVEDKAVGKGGRRTPTRLGNEPFQKGQIKDTSTESPGGATGGGKVSGAGAEGLEGPTPAPVKEQLQRLTGQQASIVNRAERIAARLKIGEYSTFRMDQAVLMMNRVRRDLEAGDYQNALRRRGSTIRAIRKTQEMLAGDIDVQRDTSRGVPKDKLEDISDAAQHPQPKEYSEALKQYYQRLSETTRP